MNTIVNLHSWTPQELAQAGLPGSGRLTPAVLPGSGRHCGKSLYIRIYTETGGNVSHINARPHKPYKCPLPKPHKYS